MDDKSICELNLNYLGQNRPTDVMVFDFSESGTIAADIAISTDTAVTNSWVFKNTPLQELYLYVAHGILHLLGYDDKNDRGKRIMQEKAKLALNRIGVRIRE